MSSIKAIEIFHFYGNEPYNEYRISSFGFNTKSQELAFDSYISGYKNGANAMYEGFKSASIEDRIDIQDTICFPLCFVHCHTIELYLKLFYIKYLKKNDSDFSEFIRKNSHSIMALWNSIKKEIDRLLLRMGSSIDLTVIDSYIMQIERFDKSSFNYRYPIDKDTKMIHVGSQSLDIVTMHEQMNKLYSYLEQIRYDINTTLEKFPIDKSSVQIINKTYTKAKTNINELLSLYEAEKEEKSKKGNNIYDDAENLYDVRMQEIISKLDYNGKVLLLILLLSGKDLKYGRCKLANNPSERSIDFYKLLISNISETGIEFNSSEDAFFHNYFRDKIESMNPSYGYEFLNVSLKELDKSLENK